VTRYAVVWHQEAQHGLARLWLDAPDRTAISQATEAVDQDLRADPAAKGALVAEDLRRLIIPPLRVLFSVSEADRMVWVLAVARC
jgi:mRNA-degrading endonuclease RelE of RelBE toxin-antitoxin system